MLCKCVKGSLKTNKFHSMIFIQKAGWQSGVYKGISKLGLTISEEIRAILYDKQNISDVCDLNGTVICKVSYT